MKIESTRKRRRQLLFGLVALLLTALIVIANVPAWAAPSAAPHNQTVPRPTATSRPSELPTATPSADDDDDDNDDSSPSQPEPVETVEPESPGGGLAPDAGSAAGADSGTGEGLTGEIVVASMNVREGPGLDYAIIGTVARGDVVLLLGQSPDSAWWVICCVGEEGQLGWASAQFIRPNVARTDVAALLPVVASLEELLAATTLPDAEEAVIEPAAAGGSENSGEDASTTDLTLAVLQSPLFVLQGDVVDLTLVVTNVGDNDAEEVVVTDQLPEGLSFVSVEVDGDGTSSQRSGDGGATVVVATWPRLPAGASAEAVLRVEVGSDLPAGTVIDNLAAVTAANAEGAVSGVSIGTAPQLLPDF